MHESYTDITSLIDEEPQWWDEAGVPRYCQFHPLLSNNVYINEAALMLIRCQSCDQLYRVAITHGPMDELFAVVKTLSIAHRIKAGQLHYGDPPNTDCCAAGATMNSIPVRVLQYWHKDIHFRWTRDETLEVDIDTPWGWTKADYEQKYGPIESEEE